MKLKAGDRFKGLRELMGMTREEFAEVIGIDAPRIKNIELHRRKPNEDDFAAIGKTLPELLPWLVYEADISLDGLLQSESKWLRLIAARIEAGQIPDGYYLDKHIKKSA